MVQIIFTPEAINEMGIKHTTNIAISELKKGQAEINELAAWRSLVFVEGISNVQINNILKAIFVQVDTAFSIITRVPPDRVHELTEDSEVQVRFLDAELN